MEEGGGILIDIRDRRCTGDGCGGGSMGDMDEKVGKVYGWEGGEG